MPHGFNELLKAIYFSSFCFSFSITPINTPLPLTLPSRLRHNHVRAKGTHASTHTHTHTHTPSLSFFLSLSLLLFLSSLDAFLLSCTLAACSLKKQAVSLLSWHSPCHSLSFSLFTHAHTPLFILFTHSFCPSLARSDQQNIDRQARCLDGH